MRRRRPACHRRRCFAILPAALLALVKRFDPLLAVRVWWHNLSPTGLFVASFALLVAIGTAGLMLLPGLYAGPPLSFIEALFTMTSAVCVTGLAVVDTATYFTFWGQLWIVTFIQLGGLGLFALTTLIIGALGRRLSLRSEMLTLPRAEISSRRNVKEIVFAVARFTFVVEGVGAVLIFVHFLGSYGPAQAAWHAVFHAISAFCNAGFSTFSNSLQDYAGNPFVLVPIALLVIIGSFGYLAGEEALHWWRSGGPKGSRRLSSHTWAAGLVTLALLSLGTVAFAVFEWRGVLGHLGVIDKVFNAFFLSANRTAGFTSVEFGQLTNASAYLTILLMIVGGSPGSMAGGIKTTGLAILIALAIARIRGRRYVSIHDRTVPDSTVQRTVSLTMVAFALLTFGVLVFAFTEGVGHEVEAARAMFLPHVFEVASAMATVGLSMDVTPTLSPAGRLLTTLLMFIGRVGPLTFFAIVSLKSSGLPRDFRPAREDIVVG